MTPRSPVSPVGAGDRVSGDAGEILAALDVKFPRQWVPIGYFLNLAAVLVAWALLVALYLALVAFFAGVANVGARAVPQAKGFWELALAVGAIALGATVALFLLKPVFARRSSVRERWALHAADEPLLFAYVARLARLVGARAPDRIVVDTRVNASAGHLNLVSFRHGRLELTLGLPLVAGLSLRELTGVLAHEFGHFRQGFGARLGILARMLNRWFFRAALERDAWDTGLASLLGDDSIPSLVRLPFVVAALCVALSRKIFYAEYRMGAVLSVFWSRQMEYDADRWECLLGGGAAFAETILRLRLLEVSSARAHEDLAVMYREGRLVDDLPALIAAHAAELPRETASRVRTAMLSRRTEPGDSHPSDLDRIERARGFGAPLFRNDAPASVLVSDLPRLCRSASIHYYRQEHGLDVGAKNLVPFERPAPGGGESRKEGDAGARYFQGALGGSRLFYLEYASVPEAPPDARRHLARLRDRFLELAPRGRDAHRELDRATDLRVRAAAAARLAAAGVSSPASGFSLLSASRQGLAQARERADGLEDSAVGPLAEVEKLIRQRMLLALALTRDPALAAKAGGAGRLRTATWLVATLAALERAKTEFRALSVDLAVVEPVLEALRTAETRAEALTRSALELLADVERVMQDVRRKVAKAPYPWGHAERELSLAEYLVPEVPPAGEWARLHLMGHEVRKRYLDTHRRLVTELSALAESVEEAVGLPRLSVSGATVAGRAATLGR